ncbi:hypothetical protein ACIPSA_38275 [Streptomyces sp. NPDC086549]|uniref:hypothetical protein n=1 Tax=Streptomyces sp. NPDC086549 TaxID=3365752 RepID=UPI003823A722
MSPDSFPGAGENPFRGSTSVQLEGFDDTTQVGAGSPRPSINVPGRVHDDLMGHVRRYLHHPGGRETRGRVLALVGEFGLGKSHLAVRATEQFRSNTPTPALWVISQPSVDMNSVFQHRLMSPRDNIDAMADFEQAITDFYADVAAEILEEDDSQRLGAAKDEFLRGLRDRRLDPQKVARAFDLDEERIHRHLRSHLRGVTDHRAFATALALLTNKDYQTDVWRWLSGEAASPALRERGVIASIKGIQGVFEALSVFSLVYGQSGRPYALVLDEVDKTTNWPDRERALFLNAFEMLVNRYLNQGGLMIFCVRPDLWSAMPASLHERVLPLWLDSWEAPATRQLIAEYIHQGLEQPESGPPYAPFTDPAVRQIVTLSDGVPRQILRICEGTWEQAAGAGAPEIGVEAVHRAIRTTHEKRPMGEVAHRLERVLAGDQWWHNLPPRGLGNLPRPRESGEPMWIEVTRTTWIALLPVPSILTTGDVDAITNFLSHARDAGAADGIELLVVVNGHACRQMRTQVATAIGTVPLVLDDPAFDDTLRTSVRSLAERLRAGRRNTVLSKVSNRLDALQGQQQTLLERVDGIELLLTRPAPAPALSSPEDASEERLPEPVRAPFRRAREAVDHLLTDGTGPRPSLTPVARTGSDRPPRPRQVSVDASALQTMGAVVVARRLLDAFREAIVRWWEDGSDGRDRAELFAICRGFEISVESLPRLDDRPAEPAVSAHRTGTPVQDMLGQLADDVLRRLRTAVSGGPAPL